MMTAGAAWGETLIAILAPAHRYPAKPWIERNLRWRSILRRDAKLPEVGDNLSSRV
jgi:hypothetical protein